MTPDLKQLQELLAKATPGEWRAMRDGNQFIDTKYNPTRTCVAASRIPELKRPWNPSALLAFGFKPEEYETSRFTDADADLIVAMHEALPALLASHEALSAEKWEQGSLLASTTDLLNTWARESNVTEAQNEKGIRDLADRLWSKLSGELCGQRRQIEALSAEVAGLRAWKESAIAVMPPMQEIGKALDLNLGESIHDKILPGLLALREDKARLDWLERTQGSAREELGSWGVTNMDRVTAGMPDAEALTLRAAIDAARQEKKDDR